MPRSLRLQYEGAIYHAINRAVEENNMFCDSDDHQMFLSYLEMHCKKFTIFVYSYCLMGNHIHLLLETKEANLSKFMQRLLGDYAMYFNHKYARVGHLFQGRYKSFIVDKESYLLELSRYIHLNPCNAGVVTNPELYKWSSMIDYLSDSKDGKSKTFLEKGLVMSYFKNSKQYHEFVLSGLNRV